MILERKNHSRFFLGDLKEGNINDPSLCEYVSIVTFFQFQSEIYAIRLVFWFYSLLQLVHN